MQSGAYRRSGAHRHHRRFARAAPLHDSSAEGDGSLSDWLSWLDQLGRSDLPCYAGQRFNHAGLLIEAAAQGLGLAIARFSLVVDLLASGTLVSPLPLSTATAFEYYLVALPRELAASPPVALFSEWLRAEAVETAALAERVRSGEAWLGLPVGAPPAPVSGARGS